MIKLFWSLAALTVVTTLLTTPTALELLSHRQSVNAPTAVHADLLAGSQNR